MPAWDARLDGVDAPLHVGLSTDSLRDLYSTRDLGPMDWARSGPSWPWRQLATWDELADITHAQRRRRGRDDSDEEEMDMTPMIDITFLLLIFFMITATFELQKGLAFPSKDPIDVPQEEPTPGLADVQRRQLVLHITGDDRFEWHGENHEAGAGPFIDPAALVEEMLEKSQAENYKDGLLILPHDAASHEAVVRAIDSAAQAGLTKVSIADIQSAAEP
jgi:biopolymer transport protein ExbD